MFLFLIIDSSALDDLKSMQGLVPSIFFAITSVALLPQFNVLFQYELWAQTDLMGKEIEHYKNNWHCALE